VDFTVSNKIQTIVDMINEFVEKELIPLEPEFLVKDFKDMLPVLREKQDLVKKMELWAPNFPTECGGMGLSLLEHGLVSEALGKSPLGHYVFWCQAPDAPTYRKASMIIVPTRTKGFNLVRNIPVMGHEGSDYFSHGEILFESCRVPKKNLLGPEGQGFVIAQERLGPGRIHHCMRWLGICRRAFDLMCKRANERVISPSGKTLGTTQTVRNWIAESAAELKAARLLTLNSAWQIDQNGASRARDSISMIKFVVANTMNKIVDRALQVYGGLGMTDDTILAYFFRHERAARIYDGADEVHKTSLAKRMLKACQKEK